MEVVLIALGVLLFIVSAISIIYPLRFLMIQNRFMAFCGLVVSLFIIGSAAPGPGSKVVAQSSTPAFSSSGGCKTDAMGEFKCSHETSLFGTTTRSELKCKENPVTQQYECKDSIN
ncbi:hypothetical protein EAS54_26275 [Bradyrhizobium guangzhouense]|nr:hypothetical protein EAS54_26275 [Bradyrhizobium guangzhouense]